MIIVARFGSGCGSPRLALAPHSIHFCLVPHHLSPPPTHLILSVERNVSLCRSAFDTEDLNECLERVLREGIVQVSAAEKREEIIRKKKNIGKRQDSFIRVPFTASQRIERSNCIGSVSLFLSLFCVCSLSHPQKFHKSEDESASSGIVFVLRCTV